MFNKALFSRKQLNIIIVVTTLVIAVLATTGPDPLPTIEQADAAGQPVYFIEQKEDIGRLRLSFSLPNNGHSSEFKPQLLYQLITQRLQEQSLDRQSGWPPISLRLLNDRLELQLNADALLTNKQLTELLHWLIDDFSLHEQFSTGQRLQATRYIQQNSSPSPLIQLAPLLGIQLTATDNNTNSYQKQLFNRQQLTISYVGPNAASWITLLTNTLATLPDSTEPPEQQMRWPYPTKVLKQPKDAAAIVARITQGQDDPDSILERAAIEFIQQALLPSEVSDWQSHHGAGLLLIASQQMPAKALLGSLRQRIDQLSAADIDAHITELVSAIEALQDQPEGLLDRTDLVARYQLPLNYLPLLVNELRSLDPDTIKDRASKLLSNEDFYWISQP